MTTTTRDKKFTTNPGPKPLQTAQDCLVAYLRDEIESEEDLKEALGTFGVTSITPEQLRMSEGFTKRFPEDMIEKVYSPTSTQDVLDNLNKVDEIREQAQKDAEEQAKKDGKPAPEKSAAEKADPVGKLPDISDSDTKSASTENKK